MRLCNSEMNKLKTNWMCFRYLYSIVVVVVIYIDAAYNFISIIAIESSLTVWDWNNIM